MKCEIQNAREQKVALVKEIVLKRGDSLIENRKTGSEKIYSIYIRRTMGKRL